MNTARTLVLVTVIALPGAGCGGSEPDAFSSGGTASTSGGSANLLGGASSNLGGTSTTGGSASTGSTSSAGSGTGGAPTAMLSLLPWKVGNAWTYQVTAAGVVSSKVTTVEAAELVGGTGPNRGVMAFRVVTRKGASGTDESVSWQGPVGDKVVRYREQSYGAMTGMLQVEEHWAPHKLHVDGSSSRVQAGVKWLEQYEETKLPAGAQATTASASDTWSVTSGSERVTVPAGTFDAVVYQKTSGGAGAIKTYYYARGVGKVKEVGASQVEELTSYTVLP
jgi:hypothetical protein